MPDLRLARLTIELSYDQAMTTQDHLADDVRHTLAFLVGTGTIEGLDQVEGVWKQ